MNNLPRLPQIFVENWAAADFVLRLDTSCGCLEPRRLDTSYDWVKFQQLDTSYGWIHPASVSGSGGWIRVAANSVPWVTWVPAAELDLRLTYILIYQVILRTFFCKMHHHYGFFSTDWFQLPLIQALAAASRTLKKLEEVWRSLKKLQNPSCDWSSCSGWFELQRQIGDLRPIDYLENFEPDAPWQLSI